MSRLIFGALTAVVAVSFGVAFAVGLASPPRDERPRTTVLRMTASGPPSRVADRAALRSVAALPALRAPRPTPTPTPAPATPARVVAPDPTPAPTEAPAPVAPAPAPVAPAPAPVAPAPPAPPAPQPAPEPSQPGPIFDSAG